MSKSSKKRRAQERKNKRPQSRNARRRSKYATKARIDRDAAIVANQAAVIMNGKASLSFADDIQQESKKTGLTNRQKKRMRLGKDPLGAVGADGLGKSGSGYQIAMSAFGWGW